MLLSETTKTTFINLINSYNSLSDEEKGRFPESLKVLLENESRNLSGITIDSAYAIIDAYIDSIEENPTPLSQALVQFALQYARPSQRINRMLSSETLQQLAVLFEQNGELPPQHDGVNALIDLLNKGDTDQIDAALSTLQKYKEAPTTGNALLAFVTQYRKVVADAEMYRETLRLVRDNVSQIQQNVNAPVQKVKISSYFKILELAGHHISMYKEKDDYVDQACGKLKEYMVKNDRQLAHFDSFVALEKESKEVFTQLDQEFQKEAKGVLHSGDILQPSNEKEENIIPDLHANDGFWDKIYFWFKNKITKHAHSALMVFDKEDNDALHYSHIVDSYQNNTVELHHFLYSDVYRVKESLFKSKPSEPYQENEDPLQTYRTTHENIYSLCKEQKSHQQVRLENNTWRKIVSGIVNFLYRLFPFIGRWIAKDTNPDDSVTAVFTTPENPEPNTTEQPPQTTKMFCSEFVAHSMNIAASQSFTLFDDWKMKRRAHYVPPQALAEHMEQEGLVEKVEDEELDIPLMKMFR